MSMFARCFLRRRQLTVCVFLALVVLSRSVSADQARTDIRPILERRCIRCHGPEEQNGQVRLDTLSFDLISHSADAETWHDALNAINLGEMPPADEPQLTKAERATLVSITHYTFNNSLKSLEPLRDNLTILAGVSHPNGRKMGGHDTADIWLTGAQLRGGSLQNSVSIDQMMAEQVGDQTRYSSLVLSTDGGVGEPTRASTLSFSRTGQPIPAENRPQLVFDRLFGLNSDSKTAQQNRLENSGSMLDRLVGRKENYEWRIPRACSVEDYARC